MEPERPFPDREVVGQALEAGSLRPVPEELRCDPWFGTHVRVGDAELLRYTNVVVVRGVTVDTARVWAECPVFDRCGRPIAPSDAVSLRDPPGGVRARRHRPRKRARRATATPPDQPPPPHLEPSRFEVWQCTNGTHTRGCLPPARWPAERQACHAVALHVWVGDAVPNIKVSEANLHITGLQHLGQAGELLEFLVTRVPGFAPPGPEGYVVDTVLADTAFALDWEVDRVPLRGWVRRNGAAHGGWWTQHDEEQDHGAVSVRHDARAHGRVPVWRMAAGGPAWGWADVADAERRLGQPLRQGSRDTFRVFRMGDTVVHSCVWPADLVAMHTGFCAAMQAARAECEFGRAGDPPPLPPAPPAAGKRARAGAGP